MFGSMGQTNVKNLGNGGTMDGDVTITGDLTVSGGIGLSLSEVIEGTSTIDVTSTEALLVRKNGDDGDVFVVDTTNRRVGLNIAPSASLDIRGDDLFIGNSATDASSRIMFVELASDRTQGFSLLYAGSSNPTLGGQSFTASANTFNIFRHNGTAGGENVLSINRTDGNATFSGAITSDGNLTLRSDSGANISFTEADGSADEMMIGYDQANQRLRFRSNAHSLDRMLITKTGQVGINIVPATTLNVASPVSSNVTTFPTLRLTSQTETADWDAGDVNGAFEFYSADLSGNAPYVNAFIKSINEQENGTLPSGSLSFGTATYNVAGGAVERMRLDSSGNVGIGATPQSSWQSSYTALQLSNSVLYNNGGNDLFLGANFYFDGSNNKYITANGRASAIGLADGALKFFVSSSTTHSADDNVSFNQALTIDTSGNIGVGTTNAAGKLSVVTTSDTNGAPTAYDDKFFTVGEGGTTGGNVFISYDQTNNRGYIGALSPSVAWRDLILNTGGGNVGIGTASPDSLHKLTIKTSATGGDWILGQQSDGGQGFRIGADAGDDAFFELGSAGTSNAVLIQADGNSHFNGGNVGIGVTPEADWLSTRTALQVGGSGCIFGATSAGAGGTFNVGQNVYFHSGGSFRRIDEDEVSMYTQRDGTHQFKVAGSSTDNSTISFTDVLKLDINSRISLSNNDSGTSNTIFGYQAGNAIADSGSTGNVLIGHRAGRIANNSAFDNNVAIGFEAMQGVGGRNLQGAVAIGSGAMRQCDSGAPDGTVAIGFESLYSLTSGSGNTAIGYQSMDALTVGISNVALGYGTLTTEVEGQYNTAIGYQTLRDQNAGGSDGSATTTANTALGWRAGYQVTTGTNNTFLGRSAGDVVETGTNNVIIGSLSDPSASNGTNQIVIGQGTTGLADNTVTLGNSSITDVFMAQDGEATIHTAGVKFPPNNALPDANANTLDDYEEGTWSITDGSGAGLSFTLENNAYVKIGKLVTASAIVTFPSTSNSSSALLTLPFNASSVSSASGGAVLEQNINSAKSYTMAVDVANGVKIRENGSTTQTNANLSGKKIRFIITYYAS